MNKFSPSASTILVVEDNRTQRLLLRRQLQKEGYQVIEAENGRACLDIIQESLVSQAVITQPNLILLDALMPEMDGFICAQKLQEIMPQCPPILMVTSLNDAESVDRAFAVGASDYITKPIHWAVLRQRVQRIIQGFLARSELEAKIAQESLLRTIAEKIRQSLSLEVVLNTAVTELQKAMNAERVAICQISEASGATFIAESLSNTCSNILGLTLDNPNFTAHYSANYSQENFLAIDDITQADLPEDYIQLLQQAGITANLVVPITIKNRLWGLLCAHHCSSPHHWQDSEIDLFSQIAVQLGIAVQQAELYEQVEAANQKLQHLATTDALTQVANRRYFEDTLQREWKRLMRDKLPFSAILCDIDFFKLYNDTYGHQGGDKCLKRVARAISECVQRPADLVARYGGEEFVVLLPTTPVESALEVAQKISFSVKALQIPHESSLVSDIVTLSVGVATQIPAPLSCPETLIAAADAALYRAKEEGRDRVRG